MQDVSKDHVILGRVTGLFGVRGWVKVFSYTEPRENIVGYKHWQIGQGGAWKQVKVLAGRRQGRGVVAQLEGFEDRDQAQALIGAEIAVARTALPPAAKDEYYWVDLTGCEVVTVEGRNLGRVDHLLETGANDVLVVKGERERLVPFIRDDVIKTVDLGARRITVDWDPEF
jgi:16S rRNA processing protein RimM